MTPPLKYDNDIISSILYSLEEVAYSASYPEYKITFMTPSVEKLTGYPVEKFLGDAGQWISLIHPDEKLDWIDQAKKDLKENKHLTIEYRIVKANGETRYIRSKTKLILDESGTPFRVDGIISDITEQKLVELALKQSNERYNLVLEGSSDGWWDWNLAKNELFYSPKWWRMLGYLPNELEPEELLWTRMVHEDDREHTLHIFENALQSQVESYEIECRFRHKNGHYIPVLSRGHIVRDEDGKAIRVSGSNMDLTERKKIAESLIEAKEMAEAANEAKGLFLANMSHEIRTPLNGIIGFSELMLQSGLNAIQQEYIKNVYLSGKNLLELVNQVLDFSKIEADKLELEELGVDLRKISSNTVDIVRYTAESKRLKLSLEIENEVPRFVKLDPLRVRQVLINLLSNALKFTNEGSVILSVGLQQKEDAKQRAQIRFAVIDTGIGIADDVRAKLFESFSQADSSITRKYGGTGLGLAISSRLLEKMNSHLQLKSEPGKGSEFYFILDLPLAEKDEGTASEPASPLPAQERSSSVPEESETSPKKKILLVEDNDVNRSLARTLLQRKFPDFTIIDAIDGKEAIEKYLIWKPDLILMDIQMPIKDGYTATREIREIEKEIGEPTPIIALTAGTLKGDKEKAMESGMNDFLTKPISPKQLYSVVQTWMGLPSL